MKLDLRYYLFHAVTPLHNIDGSKEEQVLERLKLFLESGYIYSGNQLKENVPEKYKKYFNGLDPYVYLALTADQQLLPNIITSGSESTAFSYHILYSLALVLDQQVLEEYTKITSLPSWVSFEVLIPSRVSLSHLRALYYPKSTPMDYIKLYEEDYTNYPTLKKQIEEKLLPLITDGESYIKDFYQPIERIHSLVNKYYPNVPIVNLEGRILELEDELNLFKENEEKVKALVRGNLTKK